MENVCVEEPQQPPQQQRPLKMTYISEGALIRRINRKLKSLGTDEALRKFRGLRRCFLGDFYLQNVNRNSIMRDHVDIEKLGRELGVLAEAEHLVPNTETKEAQSA